MRQKKAESFDELYDRYHQALYGTIHKIIGLDEVAEEVLHDVFIKIWQKIEAYDARKGRLFTWMINMARNSAIDKLRSKEIKQNQKTDQVDDYVSNHINDPGSQGKEDHIGIKKLLDQLDPEHQLVFELVYYKGYTQSEVSKEYDIPLGTVKTRIRNGLITLRKHLSIK